MRISLLIVLGITMGVTLVAGAADWPHFRGTNGDAISTETGINKDWATTPPIPAWRVPVADGGYSGPAVAGGILYFVDYNKKSKEDVVRAIDMATGKDKWTANYPDAAQENYGYNRSTPAIDNGMLYYINSAGDVYCLKQADGSLVWQKSLIKDYGGQKPDFMFSMSPFIDGNKLIIVPGGPEKAVVALDKRTGETIWIGGGSDKAGYATPTVVTINGIKQYVVITGKNLIGVDAEKGTLLWSYPWPTQYDVNAPVPIIVGDSSIFITSGYNHGCALVDIKDGQATARWVNKEITSRMTTPLLIGGLIYCTTESGNVVCLDPTTGKALWKQPGFEQGGLLAVDGAVIVEDGKNGDVALTTMNKDGYTLLGKTSPFVGASNCWAPPIFADGCLIVRSKTELVCIKLK